MPAPKRRSRRALARIGGSRSLVLAPLLILLAACGWSGSAPSARATSAPTVPGAVPQPDHVVVVIFENKDVRQVVGARDAPYLTSLARHGAAYTNAHGIAHPSQPNYIALLSGSTHGVSDDSCPRNLGAAPNLARQLLDAGRSFVGYAEALPRSGFAGCTAAGGRYARKHAPWVDFSNIPAGGSRPFADFPSDLATLPTVSFVIPDMCDDMHDCSVRTGDAWARKHLPRYLAWARAHDSLLVITFDEDGGTPGNRIPTILAGPMVRSGFYDTYVDHYTLLRTIEDMYGLRPLGHAADAVPFGCWRSR